MLYRKIESDIRSYLQSASNKVLVVDGARQIGKSYIIRHAGQSLFKNYIEINMEADKLGDRVFAEAKTVSDFYLALSVVAGDKMKSKTDTLVFIDELQAYDHLLTLIKFLKEDDRFTYIASGSLLGVTLKNTSSIPLGSIEVKHMYPMDFEEFLIANGVGELVIQTMRAHFMERRSLPDVLHAKILDLFKKYLIVGGLPDAVNTFVEEKNVMAIRQIQADIHALYGIDASKYEKEHSRLKIQRIYSLIPSNLENKKKRVVAKEIEGKKGKRMADYEDEFDYLISAGVALEVKAISKPSYPLMENSGKNLLKLYLNDVGLLTGLFFKNNILAVMQDVRSINLGSVYETVVAQELRAHGFNLYYYDNKSHGEVDYLIDDVDHLTVMPLEVKSGKDYTVHSALNRFLEVEEYNIREAFVLSNEQMVFQKGGITYVPIYYIMFFTPGTTVVGGW
ncbi:ATP-binding protein [Bacteroides rodentium]|jgi:predicted AAA+ superfamily ATPase|uniref:ATP-binding protein n=1 Tax=Bacteroides rodentium TaxID=691816 RepID=UPI00046F1C26|nr:AAA family ATPase [Bacteroides rodentium]